MSGIRHSLTAALALCAVLAGCGNKQTVRTPEVPVYVEGTIGQFGQYVGLPERTVQGYGVVIGLGENGSRDVPGQIRQYLVQYLQKQKLGSWRENTAHLDPDRILRQPDTAVVLVAGDIRENVFAALQELVRLVKSEVVREREIPPL